MLMIVPFNMNNLFGETIDHIPEVKKIVKEKKPVVWDIYRVTEKEENMYMLFCAKSHGHAKYLYAGYIGCDFLETNTSVEKLSAFHNSVRDCDHGMQIDFFESDYWDDCLHKLGGYYEYEDKKITAQEIDSKDIDYEFVSTIFPVKRKDISDYEVCLAFREYRLNPKNGYPYNLIARKFYCNENVAFAAMERALKNDLVDFGVSLRTGFLTQKGLDLLASYESN